MANITITVALMAVIFIGCVELRSIDKLSNFVIPADWKNDIEYVFKWEGAFSFGLPAEATCGKVYQPEHGRFICSDGTLVERNMCLVECKTGFEQAKPPVVYICERGIWKNLKHEPIDTPEPNCVPKSDNLKHHFPQ